MTEKEQPGRAAGLSFLRSVSLRLDLSVIKSAVDAKAMSAGNTPATAQTPGRSNQLNLTFNDVSYSVRSGLLTRERKKILSHISGDFRPGELTAIMGPSGAGKSTLMDILSGFTTSSVTGEVQVNGYPRDASAFRRSSAYIMQNDNLQPLLTVQETMRVAADLKLDETDRDKQQAIDLIIQEMGLDQCRTTCAGNLSGGQKKRLTIALELISNPPIMFFDEPTSGLDAVTSRQCLGLLKFLARGGRTVVCSIHQPSATLFDMIDHLYVVAEGRCAYAGGARNLVRFLNGLGLQCPTYHNPADFLLEVINGDYGTEHLDRMIASTENGRCHLWRGGKALDKLLGFARLQTAEPTLAPKLPLPITPLFYECEVQGGAYYATSSWRQVGVLMRRNAIRLSRDRFLTFTRLLMHIIIALLVGTVFYKIGDDAAYALDNFSLLFFTLMFLMFSAFSAIIITFPEELPILTREHFNRWYKLRSFYLANKLSDLPVQVAAVTIYVLVVYYLTGQILEFNRFGLFLFMCVLVSLVAQMVGHVFGTILNVQNGVVFGPCTIMPFVIFSGFFVHLSDAHPLLHWLFHISFMKYGFEGLMTAMYGYDRPKMKCSEDYCHYTSPRVLLTDVDMRYSSYWFSVSILLILYIGLHLTAYLILRIRLKTRLFAKL